MFRLREPLWTRFLELPETGMGYQFVFASLANRAATEYFVFNSEVAVTPQELRLLREHPADRPFAEAPFAEQLDAIELREPLAVWQILVNPAFPTPEPMAAFLTAPPYPRVRRNTLENEGFVRFSAFQSDHRIKSDGSIIPGTFATTVADSTTVPSGFAATGRYALPNPASAKYVYVIVPGSGTLIDGGTVRPNFSQCGGGVEVSFVKGGPMGSAFIRPYTIPEL